MTSVGVYGGNPTGMSQEAQSKYKKIRAPSEYLVQTTVQPDTTTSPSALSISI